MINDIADCHDCERDLLHCHGIAIVQPDGSFECTYSFNCDVEVELHDFVAQAEDQVIFAIPAQKKIA